MRFLDFCKSVTSNDDTNLKSEKGPDGINRLCESGVIPEKYMKGISILEKQFKCRSTVLKDLDLPHIEYAFKLKNMTLSDKMVSICEREFKSQSIPDVIIDKLANAIYGISFNELSSENKIIIKTLSMYILLSNK